jgi:hypothetical protein
MVRWRRTRTRRDLNQNGVLSKGTARYNDDEGACSCSGTLQSELVRELHYVTIKENRDCPIQRVSHCRAPLRNNEEDAKCFRESDHEVVSGRYMIIETLLEHRAQHTKIMSVRKTRDVVIWRRCLKLRCR